MNMFTFDNQVIAKIEGIIGYTFKDKNLLKTAFTHSSYAADHNTESNERMEFLGDGVLNFVVADFLYQKRNVDEGVMTVKRARIVSRVPLAKEVERLGLLQFLLVCHAEKDISHKFKSNIYEAAVAAVYLDAGLEQAKAFIERTLIQHIKKGENEDYKTKLQELVQQKKSTVSYKDQTLSQVPPHFKSTVYINGIAVGEGEGNRKKYAQQQAAKMALEKC